MNRFRCSWALRERGAATVEYVGLVMGVAALILALVLVLTPLSQTIPAALCRALASIGVGSEAGCEAQANGDPQPTPSSPAPKKNEDYQPSSCMYHEESDQFSAEVKVWLVKLGNNSGFVVQQYADGKVRVTATDGGSIGAGGEAGWKFDVGKLGDGKNSGLDVNFGGGVTFKYGDTWEFKDMKEYNKFKKDLDDYLIQQDQLMTEGGWVYVAMDGVKDSPPVPQTTMSSIGFDASVKGAFGLKNPTGKKDSSGKDEYFDPKVGVNAEITAGTKVVVKNNKQNGDVTWTYDVHASGQAGADAMVIGGSAKGSTSGSFSLTRDKSGKVTKIVFQTVREGSLEGNVGNKTFKNKGNVSGSDGYSTVVTTALDVDDSNRAIVDDWLASTATYGEAARLALPWASMVPSEPSDNPFEQLLYQQGTLSAVEYHNVRDKKGFDLAVKAGGGVGLAISLEESTADAVKATYLGAPGADGVRVVVPDRKCIKGK